MSLRKFAKRSTLLHIALFVAFFAGIYPELVNETAVGFLNCLFLYSAVVLALQLATLKLFKNPHWALYGVFSTVSFISLYLLYQERFLTTHIALQVMIILVVGCLISFLFRAIEKNERVFYIVLGCSVALFIVNLIPLFLSGLTRRSPSSFGATLHHDQTLEPWRHIEFSQRPNIHLISFESMIPLVLAKKFLNIDELPYHSFLEEKGALILKNVFAAAVATVGSLNAILKLDDGRFAGDYYFNGAIKGPLIEVLKSNGYKIATGHPLKEYMGTKGEFIDEYTLTTGSVIADSTLCKYQAENVLWGLGRRHFGICELGGWFDRKLNHAAGMIQWPHQVLGLINEKSYSVDPWFTLHHLIVPMDHTKANYKTGNKKDFEHFREWYRAQSHLARYLLFHLNSSVQGPERDHIFFIFGDHGTYTSRTLKRETNPEFFVQDRHGAFAALLQSNNKCARPDLTKYNTEYHTLGRIMASIIRCLAKEPELVDGAVNFTINSEPLEKYPYEDMLRNRKLE